MCENTKYGANREVLPSEHPTLSVIVPVHNEEGILESQTLELVAYVQELASDFEVLLVENGSRDETPNILRKLEKQCSFIRVRRTEKADYSTAVIEGIRAAKGKYSIVTGIDYVDLKVLNRCLHALKYSDIVICSKNMGFDGRPLMNRLTNRFYNTIVRLFFGLRYSDIEGYHGYNTEKIQPLISDVRTRAHLCNLWVLAKARKAGLRVNEVPFVVYEQRRSKFMRNRRLPYLATISLIEFIRLKSKGY
jgi:glycosyltransferase involved in cell wall biosynthesis